MDKYDYSWQWYVDYYFPFLYGVLIIDSDLENYSEETIEKAKREFIEEAVKYFEDNNLFYEMNYVNDCLDPILLKGTRAVLLYVFDRHRNNPHVKNLINVAYNVTKKYKSQRLNLSRDY